jgi:type IV secretory pathway TrbD component
VSKIRDNRTVRGGSAGAPLRIVLMLAATAALVVSSGLLVAAVAAGRNPALWAAGFGVGVAGIILSSITTRI